MSRSHAWPPLLTSSKAGSIRCVGCCVCGLLLHVGRGSWMMWLRASSVRAARRQGRGRMVRHHATAAALCLPCWQELTGMC